MLIDRLNYTSVPAIPLNKKRLQIRDTFLKGLFSGIYKTIHVNCVCGGNSYQIVSERERHGLPFDYLICNECGIIRVDPQFTDESLKKIYSSSNFDSLIYESPDKKKFNDHSLSRGVNIFKFIKSNVDLQSGSNVFEIGCASGGILWKFHEEGFNVVGCDLCDEEVFEFGRKKGLTLVQGEQDVLIKYGLADLLILSHIVEHLPNPFDFLVNIKKLLKPEGKLFIAVPGVLNPQSFGNHDFAVHFTVGHLFHYTAENLAMLLNAAGYDVITIDERVYSISEQKRDNFNNLNFIKPKGVVEKILTQIRNSEDIYRKRKSNLIIILIKILLRIPFLKFLYFKYLLYRNKYQ